MRVDHQPDTIDFTIASLDEPSLIAPTFHIWTERRVLWFNTDDGLPRHLRFRPATPGLRDSLFEARPTDTND
jgi:hypothetical protein